MRLRKHFILNVEREVQDNLTFNVAINVLWPYLVLCKNASAKSDNFPP